MWIILGFEWLFFLFCFVFWLFVWGFFLDEREKFEMPCPAYSWHAYVFSFSSICLLLCPVMIIKCSRVAFLLKWNYEEFWQFCFRWYISKSVVFLNIQQHLLWTIQIFYRSMSCLTFIYTSMKETDFLF